MTTARTRKIEWLDLAREMRRAKRSRETNGERDADVLLRRYDMHLYNQVDSPSIHSTCRHRILISWASGICPTKIICG
jgi:hypothetical protein